MLPDAFRAYFLYIYTKYNMQGTPRGTLSQRAGQVTLKGLATPLRFEPCYWQQKKEALILGHVLHGTSCLSQG